MYQRIGDKYPAMESGLIRYYKNKRAIEAKQRLLEKLSLRLYALEGDSRNANTSLVLDTDIGSVRYDKAHVTGGKKESTMERQIEHIFTRIENEWERLNEEILLNRISIRKMENENDAMEELMGFLDEKSKELLFFRYGEDLSYEVIAEKLDISKSNVARRITVIIGKLQKWNQYLLEYRKGDGKESS